MLLTALFLHVVVVASQELDNHVHCDAQRDHARGSLLQVSAEKHMQPSITTGPVASKPVAASGCVASLLAVLEHAHSHLGSPSALTTGLVILGIVVAMCIIVCVAHVANEHLCDEGGSQVGPRHQYPSNSPGRATNASLLKPGASATNTPKLSVRNLSMGASPMASGRLPPAQHEVGYCPAPRDDSQHMSSATRHLCPGLVVPPGNECILAVPALRSASRDGSIASLNVQDLDGKSVIQAEIVAPHSVGQSPDGSMQICLRAGGAVAQNLGDEAPPMLAYCKAGPGAGSRQSVNIYDACDEFFAEIAQDRSRSHYVLTSGRVGLKLFFKVSEQNHEMSVMSDEHQLMADTAVAEMPFNPSGLYYKLRVVSNVDVGLILCSLFAIECMELS